MVTDYDLRYNDHEPINIMCNTDPFSFREREGERGGERGERGGGERGGRERGERGGERGGEREGGKRARERGERRKRERREEREERERESERERETFRHLQWRLERYNNEPTLLPGTCHSPRASLAPAARQMSHNFTKCQHDQLHAPSCKWFHAYTPTESCKVQIIFSW